MSNVVKILSDSALFKNWNEKDFGPLVGECKFKDISSGQGLFFQGEAPDALFLVVNGTLVIKKQMEDSEEQVARLGAGDFFGELGFVDGHSRYAEVDAVEESRVLSIPYTSLKKLLGESEQLSHRFYKDLCAALVQRIRRTTDSYVGLKSVKLNKK